MAAPRSAPLPEATAAKPPPPFNRAIGRSRFVVLLAVVAVLLVSFSLFLLGTIQALESIFVAWRGVLRGAFDSTDLTLQALEIVSVMLKAVVFYIIGVGLYSLFIAPLNLTVSLGVESLSDLESKVISVVIVILGVTFLEHFIQWKNPLETLQFGGALAVVVAALVFFQRYSHQVREDQRAAHPDVQARAQKELFEGAQEEHIIRPEEVRGTERADD